MVAVTITQTMVRVSVIAALAAMIPTAEACRVMRSPQQRIADAYASDPNLQVAIVRITEARHFTSAMIRRAKASNREFMPPWRATASVVQMIHGDMSPELLAFNREWTSCDIPTTKPRRGDRWVIYYKSSGLTDTPDVVESYPLAEARLADPRLR